MSDLGWWGGGRCGQDVCHASRVGLSARLAVPSHRRSPNLCPCDPALLPFPSPCPSCSYMHCANKALGVHWEALYTYKTSRHCIRHWLTDPA